MPIRWICKGCGYLLHEWSGKDTDLPPLTAKVLLEIKYCPNCGRTLSPPGPEDFEFKAVE